MIDWCVNNIAKLRLKFYAGSLLTSHTESLNKHLGNQIYGAEPVFKFNIHSNE